MALIHSDWFGGRTFRRPAAVEPTLDRVTWRMRFHIARIRWPIDPEDETGGLGWWYAAGVVGVLSWLLFAAGVWWLF